MDMIRQQARLARRRLTATRFLGFLPWTMLIAACVVCGGLALPKLMHLPVDSNLWLGIWCGTCITMAFITTAVLTYLGRPSLSEAAAEIDRRFALRERISSAVALPTEDQSTQLGQALLKDANQHAEKIDIRDRFSWGFRRQLLLPVLPALLAGLLCYLPNREPPTPLVSSTEISLTQVKKSTQSLLEQVQKKRTQAEKEGLESAVDTYKKLEGELAELQKNTKLDTKQSLAKLNDIKQQISDRRRELGSAENLRKNLKNLEKLDSGPGEKLADAMQQGDFNKAQEALEQLAQKMQAGQMSPTEKKQLQKQLEQLQKAMNEAAATNEAGKQALQQQIEQATAAGDMQQVAQLQRKLEQAQAQDANRAQMQEMAEMLSQASQSMQSGDMQAAQEALQEMASQMQSMNQSDAELQDLDELMDSLAQSKSQMMCKACSGEGCSACMGSSSGQTPGKGMGEGRGEGDRPEEETDTDFFDSRVRDPMKIGETVYGGKVGGENRKGQTQVDVQEAVLTAIAEQPDPLDDTPLPKLQAEHTRNYYDSIRDGKP